jgi:5'-deoxynucleotidase YfbR-like HD superfamily hydrolase
VTDVAEGAIVTYSGTWIKPLEPDPELITIEDIAHSLSNACRFTGHVRDFYSVGQHSILCSWIVPVEDRLCALLHDASEAYLSDFASPIKQQPGFGELYKEVEGRLMEAIAVRFGIEWPMPDTVEWADKVLLRSEQRGSWLDMRRFAE